MRHAVNYNKWIYSNIKPYIGRRVVELGAGIGNFLDFYSNSELVVAVDYDEASIEIIRERYSLNDKIIPLRMDITSPEIFKLKQYNPDTIVLLNVLEHIQHDALLLENIFNLLAKDGTLIIQVPAMNALYGSFDTVAGHFRRYNKKGLTSMLERIGFQVISSYYMNAISAIGWFISYRLLKRTTLPAKKTLLYDKYIVPLQMRLEKIIPPPFGLSLFVIAKKNI
jgi:SAM-dependent methyltransferase